MDDAPKIRMTSPPHTYNKKLKASILPMGNGHDAILRKWIHHQPSEDTLLWNLETILKSIFITVSRALTPLQNLKLESKSNHFFQKAPPAQKGAYSVDRTDSVKLM